VAVIGDVEQEFAKELKQNKAEIVAVGAAGGAEAVFLFVEGNGNLGNIAKAAKKVKGAAALWVVYPKGRKEVTEDDVLGAGEKSGIEGREGGGIFGNSHGAEVCVPVGKR
jgi:hypothetical protein